MSTDNRVHVHFMVKVYETEQESRQKIYKTEKIAERYIDQWLAKGSIYFCKVYDFAKEKWFTIQSVG